MSLERYGKRLQGWHLLGQLVFALLLWPAFSVWNAGEVLGASGIAGGTSLAALRWGCLVAAGLMWREFLAVGGLLAATAFLAIRWTGAGFKASRSGAFAAGCLSGLEIMVPLLGGIALELPAGLHHPALRAVWHFPAWAVLSGLVLAPCLLALFAALRMRSPMLGLKRLAAIGALLFTGWAMARFEPDGSVLRAPHDQRIVMGLDSISRRDAVEPIRQFTEEAGGVWYRHAVSPGLITNAVWWSIVTGAPPHSTGVFFIFQNPAPERLPPNLVYRAKTLGLHTCAHFSDQLTMQVGALLPFDEDHSGPRGWLQVTTAALKDAGWLLPVILPHLPRLPGAFTPQNQAHTYAFSLRRELSEILTCGGTPRGSLTLAHVDYLHQARYPGFSELTAPERARVWSAPVAALVDRSIDWQYPMTEGEPLRVYAWKLSALQATLRTAIASTGVLEPGLHSRLVFLSDHGPRIGLTTKNFGDERYHGVILATFGIEPRDPDEAISLLDVGTLLGLGSPGALAADPAVEYVEALPSDSREMAQGSRPLLDGRISVPRAVLERMGARLLRFRPFGGQQGYSVDIATPASEPDVAAPTVLAPPKAAPEQHSARSPATVKAKLVG